MKVAIVGGGAAGMMAAYSVAKNNSGAEVHLFEKNKNLGAKVIISGGGRCNLTTGITDVVQVLKNYPRGPRFLKPAIFNFPPSDVREFFEDLGVPTKCEDDNRVFPVSNNGYDVVAAFERFFDNSNVHVHLNTQIAEVSLNKKNKQDSEFELKIKSNNISEFFDKLILTTGGQAYRHTGSSGDGYAFAEACGHSVTDLGPSLNSFIVDDPKLSELSGVSLKQVSLKARDVNNKKHECSGPVLITHKGLTGPVVFAMSAQLSFTEFSLDCPRPLFVDLLPEFSINELSNRFDNYFVLNPKKFFKHFLYDFLPKSLVDYLAHNIDINIDAPCDSLSKKTVHKFLEYTKNLELKLIGRGKGDEFVTAGGVLRSEIDSKSMQSKIVPGLYFAGEIIDVDGITGGFNLQASWATGMLAGILN